LKVEPNVDLRFPLIASLRAARHIVAAFGNGKSQDVASILDCFGGQMPINCGIGLIPCNNVIWGRGTGRE
jgi:hypothetical protein